MTETERLQQQEQAFAEMLAAVRSADASYEGFPSLAEWQEASIDVRRWESVEKLLQGAKSVDPEALLRAREVVRRAAAVDTGALEGLYEVSDGFTMSIALQTASMEAVELEKGGQVRALIESQMAAYEWVMDFAFRRQPITEAWIRSLHAELCREQRTYHALTEIGWQEQHLPKGEYKHLPNHVRLSDGRVFAYAPVETTPGEMFRLCEAMRADSFENAHPVLQAAFVHYALVRIHPFADGNGRVARALASVFTFRSLSTPLLILSGDKPNYLAALRAADTGELQGFVDFLFARIRDSARVTADSLAIASANQSEEVALALKRLYKTRGGYTHTQVDLAGYELFDLFRQEVLSRANAAARTAEGSVAVGDGRDPSHSIPDEGHRFPVLKGARWTTFTITTPPPAAATQSFQISLEVPKNAAPDDTFVLRSLYNGAALEIAVEEVIPALTPAARIRVSMFADRTLNAPLSDLRDKAEQTLRQVGY